MAVMYMRVDNIINLGLNVIIFQHHQEARKGFALKVFYLSVCMCPSAVPQIVSVREQINAVRSDVRRDAVRHFLSHHQSLLRV